MANKNYKNNELVSDDDCPTAELDVADLRATDLSDDSSASDADTRGHSTNDDDSDAVDSQPIPELRADVDEPPETIGRLQHDIEALRQKWLGFETEICAREEIVQSLQNEAEELRNDVDHKRQLLKKRNKKIKTLKAEISDLDHNHKQLAEEHAATQRQLSEQTTATAVQSDALADALRELEAVRSELHSEVERVASLESDLKARDAALASLEKRHKALTEELADLRSIDADHVSALEHAEVELQARQADIDSASEKIAGLETKITKYDETQTLLDEQNTTLQRQVEEQHSAITQKDAAMDRAENELQKVTLELNAFLESGPPEIVLADISQSEVQEIYARNARTEEYADSVRHTLTDLTESYAEVEIERDALKRSLERMTNRNTKLSEELTGANAAIAEMQAVIEQQQTDRQAALDELASNHEHEIRGLRSELGGAQGAVAEARDLNEQLAADLLQAREARDEVESKLSQSDERAKNRIEELEKQVLLLTQTTEEFEQKLDTRSTAIQALLGELSKKSKQIESITKIEQVVHEIDDRMSSRLDGESAPEEPLSDSHIVLAGDDIKTASRVMIGNIGDEVLRFPLFKDRVTIGRTSENDIRLKTSYVSRQHAVVLTEGDCTRVIDSGSRNGVFVNSRRVKEHSLSNGDIVTVGDARFRYVERHDHHA